MAQISPRESISQSELDKLNVPQSAKENKEYLLTLGGVNGLLKRLNTSPVNGLTAESVITMRNMYGTNSFPESPMKGFLTLFFEAFMDTTILILVGAAFISLVIGIVNHGAHGWIEGGAILIAVFLVAFVSAGNDYTKELQFRALEASSQSDERCSVIRDGNVERINPADIVVGDILLLQAGDMIPADSIIIDNNTITTPPTRTKRMSMVRPISHHLPDFVIDEKDNSDFLNELTFMIAEFPVPPSHLHPIEPFPKNSRNTGGSFISFGGWTASPNANSRK